MPAHTPKKNHPWRRWTMDRAKTADERRIDAALAEIERAQFRFAGERGRKGSTPARRESRERFGKDE